MYLVSTEKQFGGITRPSAALSSGQFGPCLTLWRPVVPHEYSYKASYARPG